MRPSLRLVPSDEATGSPYPKASLFLRTGARVVDLAIAWALYVSTGPAGLLAALLYVLFADGMLLGQSLGKKAFGVKVVFLPSRAPARHRDSVLRNSPLGLVVVLAMMPDLGLKAFLAGLVVIGGIEARRCWRDPLGMRLGDLWAQTQVIDGKVVAGQVMPVEPRQEARATGRVMLSPPSPPRG